jgi:hypothetical protein
VCRVVRLRDFHGTTRQTLAHDDLHTWQFSCDGSVTIGTLLEEKNT